MIFAYSTMKLSDMEILVLVILLLVSVLFWWFLNATPKELRKIPGNIGWPVIGESFSFLKEFRSPSGVYNFIKKRQQRYGKVYKTRFLGRLTVFVTGREASKQLLSGKDGTVSLNLTYTGKQVLGPTSLLTTAGEEHKHLRRLIGGPLSLDSLKKHLEFINDLAIKTLDAWPGKRVYVLEDASRFTLKVISHILMSLEPSGEEQERFNAHFKHISSAFASLPLNIPGTAFHRGLKARDRMYSMLDAIISNRRKGKDVKQDFLQTLLRKHSRDTEENLEDSDKLTDRQLKDNLLTLLIAGHDTTTAGLTWLIKYLGENNEVLEKLREEHKDIREKRKDGTHVTWSEVSNMPNTIKAINEALRKATILPWFSRKASQDLSIEGYEIREGSSLNLDVVSIHHDPSIFADPEKFNPSRFDEPLRPFSFLGFGSGPRMCPGIHLAKLEICVFIHHLLHKYGWKPLENDDSVSPNLLRMPRNKYPIIVEPL